MRVLGVDPGLTRCGLGVVDGGGRAARCGCVAVDVVRTPADLPLPERLLAVGVAVERWIERHRPDVVAIERVFSQHNVRTVMGTAQASGVVALLAAQAGLPVAFHTPSEVKAAVTGEGRAGQAAGDDHGHAAARAGGGSRGPADAADALALAICHCWRAPMLDRMAQAQARSAELARAHKARLAAASGRVQGRPHDQLGARARCWRSGSTTPWSRSAASGSRCRPRRPRSPGCAAASRRRLATALVVREDSLTLFGFADNDERELFGLLQTVSGIGPRIALATLAVLDPDALRRALVDGDLTTLTRVPGIGRKGAERLALELRGQGRRARRRPGRTAGCRERDEPAPRPGGGGAGRARVRGEARRAGRRRRAGRPTAGADASTLLRAALTRLGWVTGR